MKIFKRKSIAFIAIVNVVAMLVVLVCLPKLPPVVPLYYGRPAGAEQLAPRIALFAPAIIILFLTTVGVFIVNRIKDTFIETAFVWTSIIITILSAVTVLRIMLLIGNF